MIGLPLPLGRPSFPPSPAAVGEGGRGVRADAARLRSSSTFRPKCIHYPHHTDTQFDITEPKSRTCAFHNTQFFPHNHANIFQSGSFLPPQIVFIDRGETHLAPGRPLPEVIWKPPRRTIRRPGPGRPTAPLSACMHQPPEACRARVLVFPCSRAPVPVPAQAGGRPPPDDGPPRRSVPSMMRRLHRRGFGPSLPRRGGRLGRFGVGRVTSDLHHA